MQSIIFGNLLLGFLLKNNTYKLTREKTYNNNEKDEEFDNKVLKN